MLEPLLLKNPDGPYPAGKNLCFSNAVVQLLRHNLHFQQHVIFKRSSDNNVFNELYRILRHQGTTSLGSCANLRRIIGMTVGNDDLWSGNQQDAVEFLTFLLNNLDEECKQIFFFHARVETKFFLFGEASSCQHCKRFPSIHTQPQCILEISFPSGTPSTGFFELEVLLQRYFETKYSDEGEGLKCSHCCQRGEVPGHVCDFKCRPKPY